MTIPAGLLAVLGVLAAMVFGVFAIVYLVVPIFKGLGWVLAQIGRFLLATITDLARLVGAVLTALVYIPLVVGTLVIGRWSSSSHYGRAIQDELKATGKCLYRLFIGHPLRLVGLGGVVEGVERRVPAVLAAAPGADRPPARAGQFEGYRIVGSLASGGSGAKLYIAEPDDLKLAALTRNGLRDVGQVVIKSFSLKDGSTLPQIVRESRSLDAAKRLHLILDYELAPDRFYYIMRYVPGENLSLVTRRLHAQSESTGLSPAALKAALSYTVDLVRTLDMYHRGGLWHKDVKPDNIIIDGRDGRAHLVDFGLVSSLRSAMTLTTHGTEYFRDPEMVRLALRGVKVQDVDGSKFDLYGTGAVLYSMIEDSFPAHGVLSQFSKSVPESVKWIIRRAMTDYDKRYSNAAELLADLETVLVSADPFALRPIDLPSMRGASLDPDSTVRNPQPFQSPPPIPQPAAAPAMAAAAAAVGVASFPKLRVKNWWTGAFVQDGAAPIAASASLDNASRWVNAAAAKGSAVAEKAAKAAAVAMHGVLKQDLSTPPAPAESPAEVPNPLRPANQRKSAAVQLANARNRVDAARARAAARTPRRSVTDKPFKAGVNGGMVFAIVTFFGAAAFVASYFMAGRDADSHDIDAAPEAIVWGGTGLRDEAAAFEIDAIPQLPLIPAPDMQTSFGRILVVNDLMQPMDDATAAAVNNLLATLGQSGVEIVEGDETIDALAALRFEVGKAPIDAAKTQESVLNWLNSHDSVTDGVLWLSGARDKSSDFTVYPFVRSESDGSSPRIDQLRSAIAAAMQHARESH